MKKGAYGSLMENDDAANQSVTIAIQYSVYQAGHTRSNIVAGICCEQQCCQRLDLLSIDEQLLPATRNFATTYHTRGNFVVSNSCQQQSCFMYDLLYCQKVTCVLVKSFLFSSLRVMD